MFFPLFVVVRRESAEQSALLVRLADSFHSEARRPDTQSTAKARPKAARSLCYVEYRG